MLCSCRSVCKNEMAHDTSFRKRKKRLRSCAKCNCKPAIRCFVAWCAAIRSEEHTSELQSLMRSSYAVFSLKKKNDTPTLLVQSHRPTIRYMYIISQL